ncbi:MAG TPA: carboxypeptidase regulatory-like domain-containing protein, partial [Blastocatellia bacterium]|nr:carboxypeptidase regulatory-like domain-containing protein [Blastocatellia bacterium]
MLNLKMTPLIFGLFFCLPFQIAAQSQQKGESAEKGAISGRVVIKGEPAPNRIVYLMPRDSGLPSNPDEILRARTDETGQFRVTGVAAGHYIVTPLAPAFIYPSDDEYGPRGKMIKVSEGETVENVEIELYRGGVITGRVTSSQGRPLAGAQIMLGKLVKNGRLEPRISFGHLEMYWTDDRGVYRLYGLPHGRYLVSVGFANSTGAATVSRSGTYYPRVFYPNAANELDARVIEVTEGSVSADIDITVPEPEQARVASGRVINVETGQPVEGIEIAYTATPEDGSYVNQWRSSFVRSDANGAFRLRGMTPGKYALVARPESENEFFGDPVMCDLSKDDVSGLEIKVRRGGSLSGVVVIEGTNDPKVLTNLTNLSLHVEVFSTESDKTHRRDKAKIRADGNFHVRGLPPGWAHIKCDLYAAWRDFSVARVEHNGAVVR